MGFKEGKRIAVGAIVAKFVDFLKSTQPTKKRMLEGFLFGGSPASCLTRIWTGPPVSGFQVLMAIEPGLELFGLGQMDGFKRFKRTV